MKSQHQYLAALLNAKINTTALTKLTGGALPGNPHDLVTPADRTVPYDGNTDDVSADLDLEPLS